MALEPISVALKFGFLLVLYLFLAWVARSALRDLRGAAEPFELAADATGMHSAAAGLGPAPLDELDPRLRVEHALGLREGAEYEIARGVTLGRGDSADIRMEDPFASSRHARIERQGDVLVIEDLGSTNGTYVNGRQITRPVQLEADDTVRIGDTELRYRE
jgi:FHA domain